MDEFGSDFNFSPLIVSAEIKPKLLKWYENDEDVKQTVYVPLHSVVIVNTGDVGTEYEWLSLQISGGHVSNTTNPDTIARFWEQWEVV